MAAPPRVFPGLHNSKNNTAGDRRKVKKRGLAASVVAQCDGCGAFDDVQYLVENPKHRRHRCGGTFRLFGSGR